MTHLIRNFIASMSLERKCLLFFGSALLVLMAIAFLVIEKLGRELVKNYPRNRAHDYAVAEVMRRHADHLWAEGIDDSTVANKRELIDEVRRTLRGADGDDAIDLDILATPDQPDYRDLPTATPTDPAEQRLLSELESDYRYHLAIRIAEDRPDVSTPLTLADNEPMRQIGVASGGRIHRELPPVDGRSTFYEPIAFKPVCMSCHAAADGFDFESEGDAEVLAAQYPFRVAKVEMPYRQTSEDTANIRAIVVAVGMLIVAVTLYVLHAIVRHLVLYPMYHLRDVSDRITRGDNNQRAEIDTEDEFRELADAFNRMLRRMTDSQEELQKLNDELDARVDQLAGLNLQLYEANRLKSDFLANMSHELRTPLNSIIGFSDVLRGVESLSDKQRRYAGNIQKSGRLLLDMINDILDLAKVEAGKMDLRPSEVDPARLIHAQCDMMASLAEPKRIDVAVDIVDDIGPVLQDGGKIGQILNNLLSNAVKFTPEGGRITVSLADAGRGEFEIRVRDTGVGIAEEDQPVIFEKFRQSKKVLDGEGLTREFAGTGLGLSIVKELAKLLGGGVGFESELGRGSTFWVRLPKRLGATAGRAA